MMLCTQELFISGVIINCQEIQKIHLKLNKIKSFLQKLSGGGERQKFWRLQRKGKNMLIFSHGIDYKKKKVVYPTNKERWVADVASTVWQAESWVAREIPQREGENIIWEDSKKDRVRQWEEADALQWLLCRNFNKVDSALATAK